MDKLIIILLIILIILMISLFVFLLFRKGNGSFDVVKNIKEANDAQEKRMLDDNDRIRRNISEIQLNTNKDLNDFKDNLNKSIDERFNNVNKLLQEGLLNITKEMNKNVSENFEKTNETFGEIKERIAKIDEAQKNIQSVSTSIDSFKDVLENKKSRGNFGEFQLESILKDIFGERQEIYNVQKTMSNKFIADVLLKLPDPLGNIVVDSKFPLDNYRKMYDSELSSLEKEQFRKLFRDDCKKHINDISTKYIIKNETADQAMMFVPSEAVFAEIHGNFKEVVEYARSKNVWITSPTTMMAVLETIELSLKDIEISKNSKKILEELKVLSVDFLRYEKRWNDLESHLKTVVKDTEKINQSNKKITNKFKNITNSSLPNNEVIEEIELIEIKESEEDLW